ncbi:hypothetical protein [Haloglomus salinum]|uniref:hypothetical protein n=1 Tax=Haloglomus salinum TaxID=2962673 RepID=UPI0020C99A2D|nr:hypothetical protein [Haloglomus salinum]
MRWNPRRVLGQDVPGQSGDGLAESLSGLATAAGRPAVAAVETVGFWAAVLLPLTYVPLLLTGLSSQQDAMLLAALVVLHLFALSAGHTHNQD